MTFAICWGTGYLLSVIYRILARKHFSFSLIESILFSLLIFICDVISAKAMFLLEHIPSFDISYLTIKGCFSLLGVFLFSPILLSSAIFFFKKSYKTILNYYAPGILIELAFYRINCAISGCCGGININGHRFPTQIVEIICDLILFIILVILVFKFKKTNILFGVTYIGYGIIRFFLEFLRVRTYLFSVFSMSHILVLIVIAIGVASLFIENRKKKKNIAEA